MVDGTIVPPSPTIAAADVTTWKLKDGRLSSLLLSLLIDETLAIVVGCASSRAIWLALEQAFSHDSKSREFSIKGELHAMKIADQSVDVYSRAFKTLATALHPLDV